MRKRRLIIGGVSLLVVIGLVGGALYLFSSLSQPVTATATVGQQQTLAGVSYSIDLTPVPISGHYASFDYPKGLSLVSTKPAGPISLESYLFYAKDIASWTLAIDMTQPSGGLNGSSAYLVRKKSSQQYTETTESIGGQQIVIMTDTSYTSTGGFSEVAFLQHGTELATVSLLGNDASGIQPLEQTFTMVLTSWRWLQ